MGILSTGILGPFRNKTGSVIGRKHRGQDVMTSLYRTNKTPKEGTVKQKESRFKFATLNVFLNNISELVIPGFKKLAKGGNPINTAYSYNCDHAFVVSEGEIKLNLPKLVYSVGNVEGPESLQMVSENGHITMSWLEQPQSLFCQGSDTVNFLIYNETIGDSAYFMNYRDRSDLGVSLDVRPDIGHDVHCYISFASADGKTQGNSIYLGMIKVLGE
ncbi:hypothetical protein ACVWYN_001098 [Pedobacter sp. UYP24]